MFSELRPALVTLVVLSVLTGLVYPLAVTGLAQVAFPERANGSLIRVGDRVVGSRWIGQSFDDPRYFWGRLSATAPAYNGAASSGSNYGPLNPALLDAARARIAELELARGAHAAIPIDLVTASGSGLDPHISPAAARFQVARVARARRMAESAVAALVERHVEGRDLGVLGESRVNVLALNLALDAQR